MPLACEAEPMGFAFCVDSRCDWRAARERRQTKNWCSCGAHLVVLLVGPSVGLAMLLQRAGRTDATGFAVKRTQCERVWVTEAHEQEQRCAGQRDVCMACKTRKRRACTTHAQHAGPRGKKAVSAATHARLGSRAGTGPLVHDMQATLPSRRGIYHKQHVDERRKKNV